MKWLKKIFSSLARGNQKSGYEDYLRIEHHRDYERLRKNGRDAYSHLNHRGYL